MECIVHHAQSLEQVPEIISYRGRSDGHDPQREDSQQLISIAIRCSANVLISDGPRGARATLARLIHQESGRNEEPFIVVNGQDESDWRLDLSCSGSLFIEEAQCLSSSMQARLFGILEERAILPVTARVMAGASSDLFDRVRKGTFSPELFYRLNVIHLVIKQEIIDVRQASARRPELR